jgi:hypothetical protein
VKKIVSSRLVLSLYGDFDAGDFDAGDFDAGDLVLSFDVTDIVIII